ncbi:PIN domain-containing protein [bacterium]|nr:PIN domain-containing protein [bacterium]
MIAIDTNILVYAHRRDSEFHSIALESVMTLARGHSRWGIPWPCVHEFLSIVTHPKIYLPPSPMEVAQVALEQWIELPTCSMIGEGPGYFARLKELCVIGKIRGPMVQDGRIAAICMNNGVTELWSADRDFSRFASLKTRNPLV